MASDKPTIISEEELAEWLMPRFANRRTGKPFTEPNEQDIEVALRLARLWLSAEAMHDALILRRNCDRDNMTPCLDCAYATVDALHLADTGQRNEP